MKKSAPKGHETGSMSKHQKVLLGIALTILLYTVVGFLVLPAVVKSVLEKKLSAALHRTVTIENIQFNPYVFTVAVNNFLVRNLSQDDYFVAFDQLFVDVETVSVFKRALVFKTVTLNGPRLNLARYKNLSYNFSDLAGSSGPEEKSDSKPFLFSINNIEIKNGAILFLDEPNDTTHKVVNLNLAVPFLSNVVHEVDIRVEPAFSAIINDSPVNLTGRTIPFHDTRNTVFEIQVNKINIAEYLAYIPKQGNMTLKSGYLDIKAALGFVMQPGNKPTVTLSGDFSFKDIDIIELQGESYLAIPQLDIAILDSRPLEQDVHLARISISEPVVLLRRRSNGDLLPLAFLPEDKKSGKDDPQPPDKTTALKLVVDEIVVNKGALRFEDQAHAEPFHTTLNPVEIRMKGLSTQEGKEASWEISMQTEAEENITLNGTMRVNPMAVHLHTAIQDLRLPQFSPYYGEILHPRVVDGTLDLSADISFTQAGNSNKLQADNITAVLDSFAVNDKDNAKLLTISSLALRETSLDLVGRQLTIGDFSSSDGELQLVRQKDGIILMQELLKPRVGQEKEADTTEADTSAPWFVTLKKGTIGEYSIVLQDHTFAKPTTVLFDQLHLSVENISTIENSKGTVDLGLRIDKKGIVSIKGPITFAPLSTALALDVADLQVRNLQPYFEDKVTLANSNGAVSLNGLLTVSMDKGRNVSTKFHGNGGVANFSAFDPVAGEEFLKWKNLRLEGMEYDSGTFAFKIKDISWQDFYNKIVIFNDGAVNLKSILKGSGAKEEETQETTQTEKIPAEKKSLLVEIGAVNLKNGKVDFLDRSITPHYTTSLSQITGTVMGLSSKADAQAEAKINGRLDGYAPLLLTGRIKPQRDDFFADLVLVFKDIELSPTTPYTGKYIGYTVAKGKLSLDLKYLVEGKTVKGENKARLDQFTLGETVQSPDSLNLPVSLAIALLKNRRGEITLNIPVKGDLDDPQFSLGSIIFKAIINLIAKAATSPFALLGALVPEGEDLQYVDFASGSAQMEEQQLAGLKTIATALYDRPGLKMDLKGSVNAPQEKEILHNLQFERLLKNEKYKKLYKEKEETVPLDEIIIEPDEYETLLKEAYKEADFKKPKNILRLTKRIPPEEMEKLLRDNIVISEDDLRLLAIQRANAVKSFLVEAGPVEAGRLFIIEPAIAAGGNGSSRVEMIIK